MKSNLTIAKQERDGLQTCILLFKPNKYKELKNHDELPGI